MPSSTKKSMECAKYHQLENTFFYETNDPDILDIPSFGHLDYKIAQESKHDFGFWSFIFMSSLSFIGFYLVICGTLWFAEYTGLNNHIASLIDNSNSLTSSFFG